MTLLNNFADVAKNSWYAPYVAKLIKKNILSLGELSSDSRNLKLFKTNDLISREGAIKILTDTITEKNLKLPRLDEIVIFFRC